MNTITRAGVLTTAALSALLWVGVPAGAGDDGATECGDPDRVAGIDDPCGEGTTTTTAAPATTTTAPTATTHTLPPDAPAPTPTPATPADLDCGDPGTSPGMPVPADDPHDLDADDDGIGCEAAPTAPAAAPIVAQPTYTG
jgi:hypothetical protein